MTTRGQKSLRAATSETLSPGHPRSSHPRNGALEVVTGTTA
ncbi:hypothetical protein M2418_004263 [Rhizobium sp. BIGb0125]|nr:hypothetical protein [Rhizobium sp. BIGb0125]